MACTEMAPTWGVRITLSSDKRGVIRRPLFLDENVDTLEGVDTGSGQQSVTQEAHHCHFIHDRAPRSVDQVGARLHSAQHGLVEEMVGFVDQGQVKRYIIGLCEQILKTRHLDA